MYCIQTKGLTYKFSDQEIILKNLNLNIPTGSIYGFLGPNGAGKTTTLKLLLGLLRKQQGLIHIFNKPHDEDRIKVLSQIGSLIETPSLYTHLTAIENLMVWQKAYPCNKDRINIVLQLVGLGGTGNKKVGRFSLGMKQRLSIAVALLHNPQLLILDEPTNGLDPNGMIEIRDLLIKLNQEQGTTIVISSHLLSEVEKMVTDVGIIHQGSLMFEGTLKALQERQKHISGICIETNNLPKTMDIIAAYHIEATLENEQVMIPSISNDTIAKINEHLVSEQIKVFQFKRVNSDLESIFIDLTKN